MRIAMNRVGLLILIAAGMIGCGGSIVSPDGGPTGTAGTTGEGGTTGGAGATGSGGTTGTGGSTQAPCESLGACDCIAAAPRCAPRAEACWCPTECYPGSACVCGGGHFLGCEDQTVLAACVAAQSAVQTKCAGQPFVQYAAALCSNSPNAACVASCLNDLNNTGSCSEIDCGFCSTCDCLSTPPSPFAICLATCAGPPPPI